MLSSWLRLPRFHNLEWRAFDSLGLYSLSSIGVPTVWLANLLPEEEQLQVLTRSLGLDQADVLAVLKEIGGDTAGALSFGEAAYPSRWAYTPLTKFYGTDDAPEALERHFADLGRRPFLVGEEGVRQSLAGGQKKCIRPV